MGNTRTITVPAAALVLVLIGPPTAPAQGRDTPDDATSQMVVTTEWLASHVGDREVTILHVARDRAEYDAGHIPGARFVSWSEITATRDGVPNELPPAAHLVSLFERLGIGNTGRIILYGDQKGLSAARAYFTLDYLGHGVRAALLDGGLEKWRQERREVSTEVPPAAPRPFTARMNPDVLITLDEVRDLSWAAARPGGESPWTLVDARPEPQFTGAEPGADIQRPGHIPGAVNVFWERALEGGALPVLRPAAELRKIFEQAGAAPGERIVTYCRTGGQASHAYFTAKYLGYDVKMYDGSFIEWSRAPGTEVTR